MLMVKTKLGPSKTQGLGLFADEDILKGTIFLKDCPYRGGYLDLIEWSEEEWKMLEQKLSKESFRQIKRYSYKYKDMTYNLELDNARFINHSENPNIAEDEFGNDIAVKGIKKGEEILINYKTFCDEDYFNEIMRL